MAKKKNEQTWAPLVRSSNATLMVDPGALLLGGRVETCEESAIVQKTRTDFLRERAYGAKAQFGQLVVKQGAMATERNFVDFMEVDQALLSRAPADVRAQVEQFFGAVRNQYANGLLDLQLILNEKVKEVTVAPIDPPEGREEIIEHEVPNLFQRIFGGHTIIRVRR